MIGTPLLIDAHCHLQHAPSVDGVAGWIVGGTTLERLAEDRLNFGADPRVHFCAGLHPWFLPASDADLRAQLAALHAVVGADTGLAVGECGLDRGPRCRAPLTMQRAAFTAQVDLALSFDRPLVLHVVRAHPDAIELVRSRLAAVGRSAHCGLVHAFSGSASDAQRWVALGFDLGLGPREASRPGRIAVIPPEALVLETDDAGPESLLALAKQVAQECGVPSIGRRWPRGWPFGSRR